MGVAIRHGKSDRVLPSGEIVDHAVSQRAGDVCTQYGLPRRATRGDADRRGLCGPRVHCMERSGE